MVGLWRYLPCSGCCGIEPAPEECPSCSDVTPNTLYVTLSDIIDGDSDGCSSVNATFEVDYVDCYNPPGIYYAEWIGYITDLIDVTCNTFRAPYEIRVWYGWNTSTGKKFIEVRVRTQLGEDCVVFFMDPSSATPYDCAAELSVTNYSSNDTCCDYSLATCTVSGSPP